MAQTVDSGNTLIRSVACDECGARMLWTQSAWAAPDGSTQAAYSCDNGHVVDPAETAQCPKCGLHDTARIQGVDFKCRRCDSRFSFPR